MGGGQAPHMSRLWRAVPGPGSSAAASRTVREDADAARKSDGKEKGKGVQGVPREERGGEKKKRCWFCRAFCFRRVAQDLAASRVNISNHGKRGLRGLQPCKPRKRWWPSCACPSANWRAMRGPCL